MSLFNKMFRRNLALRDGLDLNIPIVESSGRAYIKTLALQTVINFLARSFSQSTFKIKNIETNRMNKMLYMMNVRPNSDSSASDFWHKVVYRLVYDNEVLIIQSDTGDLLIADDFERNEYAVYPDTFTNVIVKDYEFKRTFNMDEVLYLNYNNDNLSRYVDGLFEDYGKVFGRLLDAQKKRYQIRGLVRVNKTGGLDEQSMEQLNDFLQRTYKAFENNDTAIIPELNGFEYEELTKQGGTTTDNGMDSIMKLRKTTLDDVAKLIGIPPALIHGETADIKENMNAYKLFCLNPLIKKIEDELNNKWIEQSEYVNGGRIEVVSINKAEPLSNSEQADKLISSGAFTRNEVREMFGYEPIDGLDEFLITKNYDTLKEVSK